MSGIEVHVVHDANGRILAIAPAAHIVGEDGVRRGVTPVPVDGQFAVRLTLTDEHHAVGPVALVRDYEIDVRAGQPNLRPQRPDDHGETRL
jgi:hypothetical protein